MKKKHIAMNYTHPFTLKTCILGDPSYGIINVDFRLSSCAVDPLNFALDPSVVPDGKIGEEL